MEAVHLLTMKRSETVHIEVDRVELHPGYQSHVVPGDHILNQAPPPSGVPLPKCLFKF